MSKQSDFRRNDQPRHLHFRVRDLLTGEFLPKGGITASYTFSRDMNWIRMGASWCSLKDNYVRNRLGILENPVTNRDYVWAGGVNARIQALLEGGMTVEELENSYPSLIANAPSYNATKLLRQFREGKELEQAATSVYGYYLPTGIPRADSFWEYLPAYFRIPSVYHRAAFGPEDITDIVLQCLTVMPDPTAYTWWKLAYRAGMFSSLDLQIYRHQESPGKQGNGTVSEVLYGAVTNQPMLPGEVVLT